MKKIIIFIFSVATAFLFSCGGSNEQPKQPAAGEPAKPTSDRVSETVPAANENTKYAKGEEVYKRTCAACHQANGEGLANSFPPLAKSDYLLADKARSIKQIISGSSGEIIVNGQKYNSTMPPQNLTDEQIADVLNYVLNSWGNNGGEVTLEEVKAQR